jgi:hypothetical protein
LRKGYLSPDRLSVFCISVGCCPVDEFIIQGHYSPRKQILQPTIRIMLLTFRFDTGSIKILLGDG